MLINVCKNINDINNLMFSNVDNLIEGLNFPEWIADGLIDSIHTLPFLIVAFVLIEFIEFYYGDRLHDLLKTSKITGIFLGGLIAIIPQCGFSIMASSIYVRRLITRGTLIAVYLATSDEALPILLSYPDKYNLILPVIVTKLVIAIVAGFVVDSLFKTKIVDDNCEEIEEGCCKHDIINGNKINLWLHPILHTLNVFVFIVGITLILNYLLMDKELVLNYPSYIEPVVTSLIGLIPNCAVSVALTMMLIKGTLTFGGAIAGLCSNAGLGLLVLLRKNETFKDSIFIISLLFVISSLSGIIIQIFSK